MIQIYPSDFGRPGDAKVILPPARLTCSDIRSSTTRFGNVSVGVPLPDDDMRAVAQAMRSAFTTAFPDAEGKPKLPFRRNGEGQWLLFAETSKKPVCLDEDRRPVPPPDIGATVQIVGRIAPYLNSEKGRQGVALYLNLIRILTPPDPAAPNPP